MIDVYRPFIRINDTMELGTKELIGELDFHTYAGTVSSVPFPQRVVIV